MQNNELKIFISSPDSYSDVLNIFLQCFKKFCEGCPYELIISTNKNTYEGITVYNNNSLDDTWIARAIPVLKRLDTKYILLLCDDMIITKRVDFSLINSILDDMDKYNIKFCGLYNHIKGKPIKSGSILTRVRKNRAYAKNLQAGIFNREYLINIIGDGNRSTYDIEEDWLKEACSAERKYFDDVVSCKINVLNCIHGVLKGKWLWSSWNTLNKLGIKLDSNRDVISRKQEMKLNLYSKIGKIIPASARPFLKKVLSKLGFAFASTH